MRCGGLHNGDTHVPVAITRHGDTVGYYIPARHKRAEMERLALKEAASRLQQVLSAEGISEEEILADFRQWRKIPRRSPLDLPLIVPQNSLRVGRQGSKLL
jgi:hypothetical protein